MTRDQIERFNDNAVTRTQVQERDACLDIQARYQSTFIAIGDSGGAPSSLNAETALEYERRMLRRLLPMSERFKDTNLTGISHLPTLTAIGDAVRGDAEAAARRPDYFPKGKLIPQPFRDASGRTSTRYVGDPNACWDQFNPPIKFAQHGLASFRTPDSRR